MRRIHGRVFARAAALGLAATVPLGLPASAGADLSHRAVDIPRGRWVQIYDPFQDRAANQRVRFSPHGGAVFDSRRGRLILIGSETHGNDWSNAPRIFDVAARKWSQPHPDDPAETYRVDEAGVPVSGNGTAHPWAMHAFGAVAYDRMRDRVLLASFPGHLAPGRFTDAMAGLWPRIRRHPTWSFDLESGRWSYLAAGPPDFFAYSIVFDYHRGVAIGYRRDGIFELHGAAGEWRRVARRGMFSWGGNTAYDGRHRAVIAFGDRTRRNDVAVFFTETRRHRIMPTPGTRPPRAGYVPMAFDEANGVTVIVVDRRTPDVGEDGRSTLAETWTYDLGRDAWQPRRGATLPFPIGMNHHLVYDPGRTILLLATDTPAPHPSDEDRAGGWSGYASIWALRL